MPEDPKGKGSGEVLEEALFAFDTSKLGNPKLVGKRLEWTPPPEMDEAEAALVAESLRHFNTGLERGDHEVEVTPQGKVKVKSEGTVK